MRTHLPHVLFPLTLSLLLTYHSTTPPTSTSLRLSILVLTLSLFTHRHHLTRLPSPLLYFLLTLYITLILLPLAYVLLLNLFTGHRQPGQPWHAGLWRILVILAIWMGVCWIYEYKVKPYWKGVEWGGGGFGRGLSVVSAREELKRRKMEERVKEIEAEIACKVMMKLKTERRLEEKRKVKGDDERAMVAREQCELLELKVENLREKLEVLRRKWYEAKDPKNYDAFYR